MALRRLGFVAAQLMPKPGARQVLARAVTVDDLPGGGWSVIDERTWRTGVSVPATEWGKRARAAGSVTAWRSFEAVAARQWCWVQVMPLVSQPDALSALEGIGDRLLRNLRAEVTLLREHDVDIEAFPGAGRVWAHEQHTIGPDGEGVARTLAAACGAYVIVVSASGSPEWAWDSVVSVARRQAELLAARPLRLLARILFNAIGIGYGRSGDPQVHRARIRRPGALPGLGADVLPGAGQTDLRPDRADRAEQDNEQWHLLILQDLAQRRGLRQSLLRHRLAPWMIALFGYHSGTCMLRHRRRSTQFGVHHRRHRSTSRAAPAGGSARGARALT